LSQNGIKNLLVAGTTGEFFSLTMEEKMNLMVLAKENFAGHIMFHAGGSCLNDTIELTQFAQDNGADSVASLPPFYLAKLDQNGLSQYLTKISKSLTIPFLIYNFPAHTQVEITAELLSKIPHAGIKDSSGNLDLIAHTTNYYIGSDQKMLLSHNKGGRGFISARSNAHPAIYSEIDTLINDGKIAEAQKLHQQIVEICKSLSGLSQISKVKQTIANHIKSYPETVRLPLI